MVGSAADDPGRWGHRVDREDFMTEQLKEGWTYLWNSPKWHYFRDGKSLCGRWMCLGSEFEAGNETSPDNCVTCMKKRMRELEKVK